DYILPALPPLAILFAAQFTGLDRTLGKDERTVDDSHAPKDDSAHERQSRDSEAAAHAISEGYRDRREQTSLRGANGHSSVKKGRLALNFRDAAVAATAAATLIGTFAIFIFIKSGGSLTILQGRLASSDKSYAVIFSYGIAHLTPPFMVFLIL